MALVGGTEIGIGPHGDDGAPPVTTRFQVKRELGRGGLGVVYLAQDLELGRDVALKAMRSAAAADPGARERFSREAKLTGRLDHPGVVAVHDLAHAGGDPYYTRDRTFAYIIGQEPAGCSQISKHSVENLNPPAASYPYGGYAVFMDPFDENPDSNGGVLYNEQAVQPTVMVTDTLGNVKTVHSNLFYDDDPPVLTAGGTSAFPIGVASDSLAVTLVFTASVTDDGYQNAAPTNKKYWGIWIVATKTATAPTPATFQQYGQVRKLPAGATSLKNVLLVNGQTDMSVYGIRYVHIRFLDGAGNYTEEVITSPQITLNQGFKGILTYLPLLRK